MRLRRLLHADGGSWGTEPEDGEVVARCIRGTDFDFARLRTVPERGPQRGYRVDEFARRAARRGDLIIEKSGGGEQQPVGRVVLHDSDELVMPTNFAGRLRPRPEVGARFLCYLMVSLYSDGHTAAMVKQTTGIQNLDLDALLAIEVDLPARTAQHGIADFLDIETARIDALVAKKRRMIDLLEERLRCWLDERLGATQSAGLAKSGPWPWVSLRRVATVHGGLTLGKAYDHARPYPYLRVANVQDRRLDLAEVATVNTPPDVAARVTLRDGDVLMLEGNGNPDNLGRGTIWRGEIDGCLHQNHVHAVRVDQRKLTPEYLDWVVRTAWARWIFSGASAQVSIATLSQQQILDLVIPLPPTAVQAQLVAEVEAAHHRMLAVTKALSHQLSLLREHRQALITAAVTGEIEIPGVAA